MVHFKTNEKIQNTVSYFDDFVYAKMESDHKGNYGESLHAKRRQTERIYR